MSSVECSGWWRSATGVAYPPGPWLLGGSLRMSVFRVPVAAVPGEVFAHVPPGHRLSTAGGRVTLGVAFAHYVPGGVLQYEELLLAVAVRRGVRWRCSIPRIWVDSERSQHGGRELWGVPKRLGVFERSVEGAVTDTVLRVDDRPVARLWARDGRVLLPGRRRVPLSTAQVWQQRSVVAHNLLLGRLRGMRAAWEFDADGPLGFLRGVQPVAGAAITDAAVLFGLAIDRHRA
ncbi:acetoacetate decarboxylase family protein [Bounagaea algeriensis]